MVEGVKEGSPVRLVQADEKVETLSSIEVPEKFYKRVMLGEQVLDEMFGTQEMPGILRGSSFLFTGQPGAGKSTMALQLAEMFSRNSGMNVLYNLGEENKYMTKLRAQRLGIEGHFGLSVIEDVERLQRYVQEAGVEVLFQDSLQSLYDASEDGDNARLKSVVKKLHKMAHDEDIIVVLIGHVTKGGGFAGPREIQHDVDAHAHLRLNPDSGNRIFEFIKNRFGLSNVPFEFMLSGHGLEFKTATVAPAAADGVPGGGSSKASDRKERIVKIITDELAKGGKVSGYCFDRLKGECSGGFWRAMMEIAAQRLRSEGHVVGKCNDGPGGSGRTHIYLEV